jgi:hypothetical protein
VQMRGKGGRLSRSYPKQEPVGGARLNRHFDGRLVWFGNDFGTLSPDEGLEARVGIEPKAPL